MRCPKCNTEFEEGIFCPECGEKVGFSAERNQDAEILKLKLEKERIEKERVQQEAELLKQQNAKEALEIEKRREQERIATEQKRAQEAEEKQCLKEQKKIDNQGKKEATISLILGILAMLTSGALILPEIFGIKNALKGKKDGKMLPTAKAGLICCIVSVVLLIIVAIDVFMT